MNRRSTIRRLYPTERYGNIEFTDEINDIPDQICLNEELMDQLRYLQMLTVEISFRRYIDLYEKAHTISEEQLAEALSYLEQERETTTQLIQKILNKEK